MNTFRVFGLLVVLVLAAILDGVRDPDPVGGALISFAVNSTGDASDASAGDGACATAAMPPVCTLRAAIEESNALAGTNSIDFDIAPGGLQEISTGSTPLPTVTESVTIDGTTQPECAAGVPCIGLTGPNTNGSGLTLAGGSPDATSNSVIRGLRIYGYRANTGIVILAHGHNTIAGNYIGTDGTSADVSNNGGIYVGSGGNTIGGATAADRNVISGNSNPGISLVSASGMAPNTIIGNYIGLDVNGIDARRNADGISALYGTGTNVIGGTTAGERNIISGNINAGIVLAGNGSVLKGNYIGTDVTGTVAVRNGIGVGVDGNSTNLTVGGSAPGERNVISGNYTAVLVLNGGGGGNRIIGNYIGTQPDGVTPLANTSFGVYVAQNAAGITIGGVSPGQGNLIANSGFGDGIVVSSGTGVAIRSNSIHSNQSLGIDLDSDGPDANDAGDMDSGPNGLQNYPVLDPSTTSGGVLTVSGTLNSTPNTTFELDFFNQPACDAAGYGEGHGLVGASGPLTTDASGNFAFSQAFVSGAAPGDVITATATSAAGNTSEFSACATVIADTDNDGPGPTGTFGGTVPPAPTWIRDGVWPEAATTGPDSVDANDDNNGCPDVGEPLTSPPRSALNPWDWADMWVPSLPSTGIPPGGRDGAITLADVEATLPWVGTVDGGMPNVSRRDYDADVNANGVEDGAEYDRYPGGGISGPPNGAVSLQDVSVVLAQVGDVCPVIDP